MEKEGNITANKDGQKKVSEPESGWNPEGCQKFRAENRAAKLKSSGYVKWSSGRLKTSWSACSLKRSPSKRVWLQPPKEAVWEGWGWCSPSCILSRGAGEVISSRKWWRNSCSIRERPRRDGKGGLVIKTHAGGFQCKCQPGAGIEIQWEKRIKFGVRMFWGWETHLFFQERHSRRSREARVSYVDVFSLFIFFLIYFF